MKKLITISLICLTFAMLLAGCAPSGNEDVSDKFKDKMAAAAEKKDDEAKPEKKEDTEEEKPVEEEAPKGVPNLLLFRMNDYEWKEDNTPAIKQQISYLMLDGESAKSNKELAASLEDVRKELISKKTEQWNEDLKSIEENELITFDETWKVYLRRADENYLSFVTEFCTEGLFDDGAYTEYTAHSYYVNGGKEISFSDVIADEEAFYDLLTEKMYESIDNNLHLYYASEIGKDKETFRKELKKYMASGELVWTLDPFGVTCFLQAYTAAPFAETATIQFCEDNDHKMFNEEFINSAKDEWVIQVPGYVGSYIDVNDSGVPSYVDASEYYDYNESYDDMELSGLHVSCGGDWKNILTTMPGGTDFYNIFLLHRNGDTVVFENHDEYDQSFINTYVIARHEIREADSIRGCLEWASEKDYDINGEGYTPVYVPTDPSKIRVLTGEGEFAGDWSPVVLNIDTKGNFENAIR